MTISLKATFLEGYEMWPTRGPGDNDRHLLSGSHTCTVGSNIPGLCVLKAYSRANLLLPFCRPTVPGDVRVCEYESMSHNIAVHHTHISPHISTHTQTHIYMTASVASLDLNHLNTIS